MDKSDTIKNEKMKYFYLHYNDGRIFKGESNADFSKIGFHMIKDESCMKLNIETPFEIKIYRCKLKVFLDLKNGIINILVFNSNKFLYLKWVIKLNDEYLNKNLNQKTRLLFYHYDQITYEDYLEVKRPIRYAIKKLIYLKFHELDTFFLDVLKVGQINFICKKMIEEFENLKKLFNMRDNNCYSFNSNSSLSGDDNNDSKYEELIENFYKINSINNGIKTEILKYKIILMNFLSEIQERLIESYFSEKFTNFISIENFAYNEGCDLDNYCFEKTNSSTIKINNSEWSLIYNKLTNLLELKYNSNTNESAYTINKIILSTNGQLLSLQLNNLIYKNDKNYSFIGEVMEFQENEINYKKNGFGLEFFNINKTTTTSLFNFYIGSYKNNQFNGFGILDSNAYLYKGFFIDNYKDGTCEILFKPEKDIYCGQIHLNFFQEYGVYYFNPSNDVIMYDGKFQKDKANGNGKIKFKNKDSFIGSFFDNAKSGIGKYQKGNSDKSILYKYDNEGKEIEDKTVYKY